MNFPEKDPQNYKWNFFYYNPSDKRLFVPKSNPNFGFTFNFAHRYSYLIIAAHLLFLAGIIYLPIKFG